MKLGAILRISCAILFEVEVGVAFDGLDDGLGLRGCAIDDGVVCFEAGLEAEAVLALRMLEILWRVERFLCKYVDFYSILELQTYKHCTHTRERVLDRKLQRKQSDPLFCIAITR